MLIHSILQPVLLSWPKMGKETMVVGPTTWIIYRVKYNVRFRYWDRYSKQFEEGILVGRYSYYDTYDTYEHFIKNLPATNSALATAIWHEESKVYVWVANDELYPI